MISVIKIQHNRSWRINLFAQWTVLACIVGSLIPRLGQAQPESYRFVFHRGLMGTQFNLILYAPDSVTAQRVNTVVSARMDTLNQIMSDYLDGSEINRLSATSGSGSWVTVSPELFDVLQKAQTIARLSHGRFDPTVGPLSLLWRRAVRRKEFPSNRELRNARRLVNYRLMELNSTRRSVRLRRSGMRLDVGGIGQGFAIDEAMKVLHQFNIRVALLDIGGDILVSNPPPESPVGWRVGMGSKKATDPDSAIIFLKNAAVTTSGDMYRFLEYNGRRYSHILDPRSGLGLSHFVQATVLAPNGYQADALTKVFSVAGLRKSQQLLKQWPGVKVLVVENKKGRLRSWQSAEF